MKNVLIYTFILFALVSCGGKKEAAKGNFKLIVGSQAMAVPMNGGVFLETHELTLNDKKIYKLDVENSATFPTGTYDLLIVAFTGPSEKDGIKYCGSVSNAALLSATVTVSVTIKQANCNDPKFTEFISRLIGNNNWDSAKFDQGKWGP